METTTMEQGRDVREVKGHSAVADVKLPMLMVLMVVVGVFAGPSDSDAVLMAGSLALAAVPCVLLYMTLTLQR